MCLSLVVFVGRATPLDQMNGWRVRLPGRVSAPSDQLCGLCTGGGLLCFLSDGRLWVSAWLSRADVIRSGTSHRSLTRSRFLRTLHARPFLP